MPPIDDKIESDKVKGTIEVRMISYLKDMLGRILQADNRASSTL